jgi:glycine/D-amino acid oxidase-like deaminating enzyme
MRKGGAIDVAVVGAGVFGLCAAWFCAEAGLRVTVFEAAEPGAGASGGVVGALVPHQPRTWSEKKAFQRGALAEAESFWRGIAAAGCGDPGYGRIGRVVPLPDATARDRAILQAAAAAEAWPAPARWEVLDPHRLPGWLVPGAAPHGAVRETFSARLHPRRAVAALVAALRQRGVDLRPGTAVRSVEPGLLQLTGEAVAASAIVLAAGTGGTALTTRLMRGPEARPVKGQAALLGGVPAPDALLLTADGLYVVPHADGTTAVGSTSESTWDDPAGTDDRLDALVARARAACPGLAPAPVVARWAALRPRAPKPDPLVGPVPGAPGVFLANGGFKIGFGIAHAVGRIVADQVQGYDPAYPARFRPEGHGFTARS